MAPAAEALQVRLVVRVAALVERDNVIAFQPPGPAARQASPAVALKDAKAKQLPAPMIQRCIVSTTGMLAAHQERPMPERHIRMSHLAAP